MAFHQRCVLFYCFVATMAVDDKVRMPPYLIEEQEKNGIFREDGTFIMNCRAAGIPPPEYEWIRNGAPLDFNAENLHRKEDGKFEINPTTSRDEGFYRCTARNQYGTVTSNTTHLQRTVLQVSDKRKTTITAQVGQPARLEGVIPKCFPAPTFSWEIGKEVDNNPKHVELDSRIQISDLGDLHFGYVKQTDATDSDKFYKLIVFNAYRDVKQASNYIQLSVTSGSNPSAEPALSAPTVGFTSPSPTVAVVGRNITLRCFFNGNPSPRTQWDRRDGKSLPVNRHYKQKSDTELVIDKVEYSDEGGYVCKARTDQGSVEEVLYINVEAEPTFQNDTDRPHNTNVTEGQTVIIRCITKAEPDPSVVWMRNGEPLRPENLPPKFSMSSDKTVLTIRDLCKNCPDGSSDLQVIQCNSSNKHGYALGSGYVNVLLKTRIVNSSEIKVFVDNSDAARFEFPCQAVSDASTPVHVTWYNISTIGSDKSGNPESIETSSDQKVVVADNGSLIIHLNANDTDGWKKYQGKFRCRATNTYSEDVRLASVTVNDVVVIEPSTGKAGLDMLWWILIIVAGVLLVFIILVCCIFWCERNQGDSYPVDQKERKNGNNPEKELLAYSFQDYQRPCESTLGASRASLNSDGRKTSDDDDGSINEYGNVDPGKFNEDGSFVGVYSTDDR